MSAEVEVKKEETLWKSSDIFCVYVYVHVSASVCEGVSGSGGNKAKGFFKGIHKFGIRKTMNQIIEMNTTGM